MWRCVGRWLARIMRSSMPSRRPRSATVTSGDGPDFADGFEDGAAGQHEGGAVGADAGVTGEAFAAHGTDGCECAVGGFGR